MDLNINNVINISVAQAGQGVGQYNTSNLAIFSHETPDPVFADGFKIYLEPSEVGVDFGTDSVTYKMALAVFSQQPNILANGGYLVVIPLLVDETIGEAVSRTSWYRDWETIRLHKFDQFLSHDNGRLIDAILD